MLASFQRSVLEVLTYFAIYHRYDNERKAAESKKLSAAATFQPMNDLIQRNHASKPIRGRE
jgi:hypothetical protein